MYYRSPPSPLFLPFSDTLFRKGKKYPQNNYFCIQIKSVCPIILR